MAVYEWNSRGGAQFLDDAGKSARSVPTRVATQTLAVFSAKSRSPGTHGLRSGLGTALQVIQLRSRDQGHSTRSKGVCPPLVMHLLALQVTQLLRESSSSKQSEEACCKRCEEARRREVSTSTWSSKSAVTGGRRAMVARVGGRVSELQHLSLPRFSHKGFRTISSKISPRASA